MYNRRGRSGRGGETASSQCHALTKHEQCVCVHHICVCTCSASLNRWLRNTGQINCDGLLKGNAPKSPGFPPGFNPCVVIAFVLACPVRPPYMFSKPPTRHPSTLLPGRGSPLPPGLFDLATGPVQFTFCPPDFRVSCENCFLSFACLASPPTSKSFSHSSPLCLLCTTEWVKKENSRHGERHLFSHNTYLREMSKSYPVN